MIIKHVKRKNPQSLSLVRDKILVQEKKMKMWKVYRRTDDRDQKSSLELSIWWANNQESAINKFELYSLPVHLKKSFSWINMCNSLIITFSKHSIQDVTEFISVDLHIIACHATEAGFQSLLLFLLFVCWGWNFLDKNTWKMLLSTQDFKNYHRQWKKSVVHMNMRSYELNSNRQKYQ